MSYRVVVAEDEALLLNNLVRKIDECSADFTVVGKAQTGIQALELVETLNPRLLITDIRMPVLNGLELIERAKEIDPSLDCIIISGYSEFEYAQKALHLNVIEYLLKPIDNHELYALLSRLEQKYNAANIDLNAAYSVNVSTSSPKQAIILIKELIDQNYMKDISLPDIAEISGYNLTYITRFFEQEYHTTPLKYLTRIRIQKAQYLLLNHPELTIQQIGDSVGYPDPGYFSRVFKKQTGHSPNSYRQSV